MTMAAPLASRLASKLVMFAIDADGGTSTVLRREADGTVTFVSADTVRTPILTRNADGTVTVS